MPHATTQYFGDLEYEPQAVIRFAQGLPGFENLREFLPIEQPATRPLVFLQNIVSPEPCFVTLPVELVEPDYRLELAEAEREALGFSREQADPGSLLCLVMVAMQETGWTANLMAPVVVNVREGRAVQAIQSDSSYSHQHELKLAAPC